MRFPIQSTDAKCESGYIDLSNFILLELQHLCTQSVALERVIVLRSQGVDRCFYFHLLLLRQVAHPFQSVLPFQF